MISLYTRPARTVSEREQWIRRQALLVLIYEGIVAQTFDYDYAPQSILINDKRVFFNMSQEGASDLDFLREEGLLNSLRLSSSLYNPVVCYQISNKGVEIVRRVLKSDRDSVHGIVYPPGVRELLEATWTGDKWVLRGAGGFEKVSSVTDTEDVSYVGSAYIPQCLRFGGRPTLSNAHRAAECARAASNIRDVLDEIITLNSVSIVVAEYIPFGANNLAQVNANLGSADRVAGGFYSALVDTEAGGTQFIVDPGLTNINVLDYSHTRHANFEADIYMPVDAGIVQVETLGISVNADGTVFYGMQIEAVMDRIKDNISVDQLSRLLVDVTLDSTTMVDSVVSGYQRKLLHLIYSGNASNRDKMNLLIANEITPHLTAEEYMDKGDYENELKQVLGDTRAAFDISEHDTLIFGSQGLLIAGPNARAHEPLLCSYLQFMAMDLFIRNFFARSFTLNDSMNSLRRLINSHFTSPHNTSAINDRLQLLSDEVRMMGEILGYLVESLETCEIPTAPTDLAGKALYQRLQIADLAAQLSMRVLDLKKLVDGSRLELAHLRHLAKQVADMRTARVQEEVLSALGHIIGQNDTATRSQNALRILTFMVSGILAFCVLDRLTGSWTVMDSQWMQDFANPMIKRSPLVWFLVNMLMWGLLAFAVLRVLNMFNFAAQGTTVIRVRVMQRIILERFYAYLATKVTSVEERGYEENNTMVSISWEDADPNTKKQYGGIMPRITAYYDKTTGFMHWLTIDYNRRLADKKTALTTLEVKNLVSDELVEAGFFVDRAFAFREDPRTEQAMVDVRRKAKSRGRAAARAAVAAGGKGKSPSRSAASKK